MILCCGEALVDFLPGKNSEGLPVFLPRGGGAAFNTAIALGHLGAVAGLLAGISNDQFGSMLEQNLAASNVSSLFLIRRDRPTTLAFVHEQDGRTQFSFHDENSAGRMIVESDLPELGSDVSALHFSGISLAAEPCGSTLEALCRRERPKRLIMLDPNIRPSLIADPKRHRARMDRMIAMADIVKLSEEDLAWFDEPGPLEDIAGRWLAKGPALFVVTSGKAGAVCFTRHVACRVPAPEVRPVDSVGAGDAFSGAMLAALQERRMLDRDRVAGMQSGDLHEILTFAAAAAAISVSRQGAEPPWAHELASSPVQARRPSATKFGFS